MAKNVINKNVKFKWITISNLNDFPEHYFCMILDNYKVPIAQIEQKWSEGCGWWDVYVCDKRISSALTIKEAKDIVAKLF